MPSRKIHDGARGRLAEILERVPMTPWWWYARWRRRDCQNWIRHVRNHYGAAQPERR